MNSLVEMASRAIPDSNWVAMFLDTSLKGVVVLALAAGLCLAWRRASAAARHWVWFLAVLSLPLLPLLSSLLPSWPRPLWSVSAGFNSGNRVALTMELAPAREALPVAGEAPAASAHDSPPAGGRLGTRFAAQLNADWLAIAAVTWSGVAALVLLAMLAGWIRRSKISRNTELLRDDAWSTLLRECSERLRVRRAVTLLRSRDNVMPMTWGWRRPAVLVPADAEQWPAARRRIVLLHELAHVKRRDCLTQLIAGMVCALYWFNPLVWLAAWRMCVERERAADDLVLNGGCKASDYAGHLVDIARTFRRVPQVAAIAMARSTQLTGRVKSIVGSSRRRNLSRPLLIVLSVVEAGLVAAIAAQKPEPGKKPWFDERLRDYFVAKETQAYQLAALEKKEDLSPVIWRFFDAGTKGDWTTVTNLYGVMRKGAYQYEGSTHDKGLETMVWQPVNEAYGAWQQFAGWGEKYVLAYGEDIIKSIPPGSIYFGGTDPGRWVITAMSESHAEGKPFFTITQNALADGLYEEYIRAMYAGKINMPTTNEVEQAFNDYSTEAGERLKENKLRPGEQVSRDADGRVHVQGQVAVMAINALIARTIFDKNPDREFYIEESFPLEWMYPHLSPNGLILKINRESLAELSEEIVRNDHAYWSNLTKPMIGDWLNYDTPIKEVAAFAEKVYLQHDLRGFKGDPAFVGDGSQAGFAKERASIAGVYAWRVEHAANESERARMIRETDFAFRQAWALCPFSLKRRFAMWISWSSRSGLPTRS